MPGSTRCEAVFARADGAGGITGSKVRLGRQFSHFAAVEWTGSEWLTTWNDGASGLGAVFTAHVSPSGAEVPGSRRQLSCRGDEAYPTLGWDGARASIAFIRSFPLDREVLLVP